MSRKRELNVVVWNESSRLFTIMPDGNVSCTGSLGVSTNITCNAITCSSTGNALYVSGGDASIFSGKVGILNAFPQATS